MKVESFLARAALDDPKSFVKNLLSSIKVSEVHINQVLKLGKITKDKHGYLFDTTLPMKAENRLDGKIENAFQDLREKITKKFGMEVGLGKSGKDTRSSGTYKNKHVGLFLQPKGKTTRFAIRIVD